MHDTVHVTIQVCAHPNGAVVLASIHMPGVGWYSAQRAALRRVHPSPTEHVIIMVTLYKKATNEQHSA